MKKQSLILMSFLLLCGCNVAQNEFFMSPNQTPVMQKNELVGRSAGEVVEEMGEPRTVLKEAPHQVWTYRKDQCVTLVFFDESEKVCFAEERGACPSTIALTEMKENVNGTEDNA